MGGGQWRRNALHLHGDRAADRADAMAYVQLAEGPLMLTNLVDCDAEALAIGAPLRVVFRRTAEGRSAPVFRLV